MSGKWFVKWNSDRMLWQQLQLHFEGLPTTIIGRWSPIRDSWGAELIPSSYSSRFSYRKLDLCGCDGFVAITLLTKLTIAEAGWSESCSAKTWHWLSVLLPVFLATNPKNKLTKQCILIINLRLKVLTIRWQRFLQLIVVSISDIRDLFHKSSRNS